MGYRICEIFKMNLEKHIRFVVDKLNLLGFLYIHKIDKDRKWRNFKRKNIQKCIDGELYFDEKSQENKYHNKRTRQFSNIAKLLLINDDFINDILEISEIFQLTEIAFGIKKAHLGFLTEESRRKYAKLPDDYLLYNYEITKQCLALWKCWLHYQSFRYMQKYQDKINFQQTKELLHKNLYYQKIPSVYLNSKIINLLKKYNLSKLWEDSIKLLLATGKIFIPDNFCPIVLTKNKDEIAISIPIYKETRLEDIEYRWKDIKSLKDEYLGTKHIKSFSNIDPSIGILLDKTEGIRYWDLIDLIALDIPEDLEEETKAYNRIRKATFRIKKASENLTKQQKQEKTFLETLAEFAGIDNPTYKL
ncbi:MAG: hypothetical protein WD000_07045 [Thermodesulfobacteriota bacterium]